MQETRVAKRSLLAGIGAALAASLCCVGPLVLLALGVSGAWIAQLTALEPIRPVFIGVTLLLLSLAFYKLYIEPRACAPTKGGAGACVAPAGLRRQRAIFWLVALFVVALLTFPWYAQFLIV